LTVAAVMTSIVASRLRAKLSPGWVAVTLVGIAVLITFGPIRFAEAMSTEVLWISPNSAHQPRAGEKPWSWPSLAAYCDARAWAGYSLWALALLTLAMLAVHSLLTRWKDWLWTEWAVLASASIIAGCWILDEFVSRPARDRLMGFALGGVVGLIHAVVSPPQSGTIANAIVQRAANTGLMMAVGWYLAGRVSGHKVWAAHGGAVIGFLAIMQHSSLTRSLVMTLIGGIIGGLFDRFSSTP
jgi:hypothetical protein